MKSLLRNTVLNAVSIYFISLFLEGVKVSGGFWTFIAGGLALSLLFLIVKPILNFFSAPLNFLTLGFFSIFTNIIIFYLLTVFVGGIAIEAFTFKGLNLAGFVIPKIYFNIFFAFVVVSFCQSFFVSFVTWLFRYKK